MSRTLHDSSASESQPIKRSLSPESDLISLHKQIKLKEAEILKLKNSFIESKVTPRPLKDVGKNITYSYVSNKSQSSSPQKLVNSPYFVKKHTINLPNPRFSDFDPITGLNRQSARNYSPFQGIARQCVDGNYMRRPPFN